MLRVPVDFHDNATRALFPRQLILYEEKANKWAACTDPKILVNIDYLAVSYCQTDFADKVTLENMVRFTCQILQLRAYWLDFACIGQSTEEKNRDLYRIADVFRGAKKTVIMINGDDDSPLSAGWLTWGDQISALPEALLSHELFYKAGTRFVKPVSLRRLANLAYKDRHDEMMLIDGYSGKDTLPLQEKVELLWKAIRKRSNGISSNDVSAVIGKKSGLFRAYAAERVYALMGFMQYRIVPDLNESEETAFIRLMQANKLGGCTFSWGIAIPLLEASKTDDIDAAVGLGSDVLEPSTTPDISPKIIDSPRQHVEQSNCYEGHNSLTPVHIFDTNIDWESSKVSAKARDTYTCADEANNAASMFLAWMSGLEDLDEHKERFNKKTSGSSLTYYKNGRSKLAMFAKSRYMADLNLVVMYFKNAVEHSLEKDIHLARYHVEWGRASLLRVFHDKKKNEDLTQAINSAKEVISLCGSRSCPAFYEHYLLTLYRLRYKRLGNADDLHQAIRIGEKLLLITPSDDPEIARYQYNLASTFYRLFLKTDDIEHLNRALEHSKKALHLPTDSVELNTIPGTRPLHCSLHASLLKLCFDKSGDMKDLDLAIKFEEEALRTATDNNYNLPSFFYNLASMLFQHYERTSSIHNLNEAITILDKAVHTLADDRLEKAGFQTYLASSYKARYSRLGDLSDLDLSIACHEDALRLTQLKEPHNPNDSLAPLLKHLSPADMQRMTQPNGGQVSYKPLYLHNLAITLRIRFEETENLLDIDQAIQNDTEAIRWAPDNDKDKACFHDHLGFSYRARFDRTRDLDDIDRAITSRQEAVRIIGDNHLQKPVSLDNLGITLGHRFVQMGKVNRLDIDRAISSLTEALRRTKDDNSGRIKYLDDLARLLEVRFDKYRERKDLEELILRRNDIVNLSQTRQIDPVKNETYLEELRKSQEKLNQFQ